MAQLTLPPSDKVSPAKAAAPAKKDVPKGDGVDIGKDVPKRAREGEI